MTWGSDSDSKSPRAWQPRIEHPLQPAIHFQGRRALLDLLATWLDEPGSPTRVVSLVAVGGAGKTAVVEQLLRRVRGAPLQGGLFVWSFYENNRTEDFLQRACEYFARQVPDDAPTRLHALQQALSDGSPHLVVLDGIELVQAARAEPARPRGSLRDPLLKLLLRSLADGLGRSRAMITSRFPLPDLRPWEGEGARHWPVSLDALDDDAAAAVFASFGVRGDRAALVALAAHLGHHALSVAVLAAYLGEVCGGDPGGAARFELASAPGDDPLASKLTRVLTGYAAALPRDERHALALLSTLPRGADAERLASLMAHAPLADVAGLVGDDRATGPTSPRGGHDAAEVRDQLDRLTRVGLVFSYRALAGPSASTPRTIYTAHPFVRDYFRNLVDVEAVNRDLAELVRPSMQQRPGGAASSADELDRIEQYIEHVVQAGQHAAALDTYRRILGGHDRLASLHEHVRGRRILELILQNAPAKDYYVLRELGRYAEALGELDRAEQLYDEARDIFVQDTMTIDDLREEAEDFARLYLRRGALPRAADPLPLVPASLGLLSLLAVVRTGGRFADHAEALALCAPNVLCAAWSDAVARRVLAAAGSGPASLVLRGHLALPHDLERAGDALARLRSAIARSSQPQLILAGHHLASRLALEAGDVATSLAESSRGIQLADACGFGLLGVDLRLMRAWGLLAARQDSAAYDVAVAAVARAEDVRCDYRWGAADAWHLRGLAARAVDWPGARIALEQAAVLRAMLGHPGVRPLRDPAAVTRGSSEDAARAAPDSEDHN